MIPCYDAGPAEGRDDPAFVSFPYTVDGISQEMAGDQPNPNYDATLDEIGSTWGVAYHIGQEKAFASTLLKRHVGIGPAGFGALYMMDYSNPDENGKPAVSSMDFEGLVPAYGPPIKLGEIRRFNSTGDIDETMPYTITSKPLTGSYDLDAFPAVGKVAFGDIDLTENQSQLWMVNLNQRSLIQVDIDPNFSDISSEAVRHYPIDDFTGLPNLMFRYMMCINTGGNQNADGAETFTAPDGRAWDKNKYSSQGSQWGFTQYQVQNTLNPVDSTTSDILYQSYRRGNFQYDIPIPKEEQYTVILHFADPEFGARATDRIFNVKIEGQTVLDNFDIIFEAGDTRTAITKTFKVQGSGDKLNIEFESVVGEAIVSGIEIRGTTVMNSGVLRPWGLKFANGKGYIGVVSDASVSQSREHLNAYILSFDPNNPVAFTEELAFRLAYPRERASNAHLNSPQPLRSGEWHAWADEWDQTMIITQGAQLSQDNALLCSYPQPIVSDIEFTDDGSMVIGLMDRFAHQCGYRNFPATLGDRTFIVSYGVGDLLKGFIEEDNNGLITYNLEREDDDPGVYNNSALVRGAEDGPSFAGEFFYDDHFISNVAHHGEIFTGGMALKFGSQEVAVSVFNPINTGFNPNFINRGIYTQGIQFHNTEAGTKNRAYLFVDQFIQGKANGLGDMEFLFSLEGGEIGNLVWCDANGNGVQDGTEFGIPNIKVVLIDKSNNNQMVAMTTTDENGNYSFDQVEVGHCYEIRIDRDQLVDLGFTGYCTSLDAGTNDMIDSDGDCDMLPGFAVTMFCYDAIANDHNYDFGFEGPAANAALVNLCVDPTNCAADQGLAILAEIEDLVDPTGDNMVMFYPDSIQADTMGPNEIMGPTVCVANDSMIWARVMIEDDDQCFALAKVTFIVSSESSPTEIIYYPFEVCEGAAVNLQELLSMVSLTNDNATFCQGPCSVIDMNGMPVLDCGAAIVES